MSLSHNETVKNVIDSFSVITVVGTIVNILPAVAAVFTIVWTGIRIWETDTVQRLFKRPPNKKIRQRKEEIL
jgi:hypothetical protein